MKIGIYGYGNLGRGVEYAVAENNDIELAAVFTRRNPDTVKIITEGVEVISSSQALDYKNKIDVLVICGGSVLDLPEMTPYLARHFNVVDSFDIHTKISEHYKKVDAAAKDGGNIAIISAGWDPGLFSLNRLYASAALPNGRSYTFWGKGVSQGHSEAVRRIDGVIDARQYTIPVEDALQRVKNGENPCLSARQKHKRVCYVVAEALADKMKIEKEIKTMPDYFAGYDTDVIFISKEEMELKHGGLPHGGSVIRTGVTGEKHMNRHLIEYKLSLDSNPEFTSGILVAYARAAFRMRSRGDRGCKTVFEITPADLSALDYDSLISTML